MLEINTSSIQIVRQYQKEQLRALQYVEKIQKSWNSLLTQKKVLQVQVDTLPAVKKFSELTRKMESFSAQVKIILSVKDMITSRYKQWKDRLEALKQQKVDIPVQIKGKPQSDPIRKAITEKGEIAKKTTDSTMMSNEIRKRSIRPERNPASFAKTPMVKGRSASSSDPAQVTVSQSKTSSPTQKSGQPCPDMASAIVDKNKLCTPYKQSKSRKCVPTQIICPPAERVETSAAKTVRKTRLEQARYTTPTAPEKTPQSKTVTMTVALKDKVTGILEPIKQKLDLLHKKVIQPMITIKDKVMGILNPIKQKFDQLNKKVIQPIITIKDQITKKIQSIKDSIRKLTESPIAKMTVKLVQAGLEQEKQKYAVTQTVARTNQGRPPKEITAMQNSYYSALKKNAYQTSFSMDEVMNAGSVALEATGGKTGDAMELVKVAENMAAMNPGKSLAEAIEALAGLKAGNTEQMQDFGWKATPKDVQKAGGVDAMINMKIKPFFAGGTDQLMNTGGGLIATIQEKLSSKFSDLGLGMVNQLKPHLQSINDLIDRFSPVMDKLSGVIADGFGWAMTQVSNVALPALDGLGKGLEWVADILGKYKGLGTFVKGVAAAFVTFKIALIAYKGVMILVQAVTQAWKLATMGVNLVMKMSPIGWIVLAIGALVAAGVLLVKHWDTVKAVAETVWNGIAGFFTGTINRMISLFQSVGQAIADFFTNVFQNVMVVIQPIIDSIQNALGWVQDIGKGIGNFVGGIASWITGDKKKQGKHSNTPKAAPGSNNLPNAGGSSLNLPGYAVGLHRVPRNNYPALLHEGERVLTQREAMLYDRRFETVRVNAALERTGSRQTQSTAAPITIAKIAESIIIREEADIQKIANALAASLEAVAFNYAGR